MATKGITTRAAIYTRKSSLDERSDDNRSTTAQERECRAQGPPQGFDPEAAGVIFD
jgi:hypothetical protein